MFRILIDKARLVAQVLRRLREEFAEAQQHMVPVWFTAVALIAESTRWM